MRLLHCITILKITHLSPSWKRINVNLPTRDLQREETDCHLKNKEISCGLSRLLTYFLLHKSHETKEKWELILSASGGKKESMM